MADVLISLDELDAADPRVSVGDDGRTAIANASQQCITPEVLAEVEVATPSTTTAPDLNIVVSSEEETSNQGLIPAGDTPVDFELQRSEAIGVLMAFGRSLENATCIVDHLIDVEAAHLFASAELGLGLDPNEATAFAVCLSFS